MIEQCTESKIYKTKDYDQFKVMKGNRETKQSDIKKLTQKIKRRNMLRFHPVLVNSEMEILDGQHRVQVAKQLNETVYFMVVEERANIQCVIDVNTTGKQWKMEDFLKSYIKQGNEEYIALNAFLNKYPILSITQAVEMFLERKNHPHKQFKAGYFKTTNIKRATDIAERLSAFVKVDKRVAMNTKFQRLMLHVYDNEVVYDHDKLVQESYYHVAALLSLPSNVEGGLTILNKVYGFRCNSTMSFLHTKKVERFTTTSNERGKYNWIRYVDKIRNLWEEDILFTYKHVVQELELPNERDKSSKSLHTWIKTHYGTKEEFLEQG